MHALFGTKHLIILAVCLVMLVLVCVSGCYAYPIMKNIRAKRRQEVRQ